MAICFSTLFSQSFSCLFSFLYFQNYSDPESLRPALLPYYLLCVCVCAACVLYMFITSVLLGNSSLKSASQRSSQRPSGKWRVGVLGFFNKIFTTTTKLSLSFSLSLSDGLPFVKASQWRNTNCFASPWFVHHFFILKPLTHIERLAVFRST